MSNDILFYKYDMSRLIEAQRTALRTELDAMADERLLNTDLTEMQKYAPEKYTIDLPVLGEPVVDEARTKTEVGRYGGLADYGKGRRTAIHTGDTLRRRQRAVLCSWLYLYDESATLSG